MLKVLSRMLFAAAIISLASLLSNEISFLFDFSPILSFPLSIGLIFAGFLAAISSEWIQVLLETADHLRAIREQNRESLEIFRKMDVPTKSIGTKVKEQSNKLSVDIS